MTDQKNSVDIVSIIALFISFVALTISFLNYRRTNQLQQYEYAARIQICNEEVIGGSRKITSKPAFSYNAVIENRGAKPIKISRIFLGYGDKNDDKKRIKLKILGETFLSPGQSVPISKNISWKDVEEINTKNNAEECFFFLRITYITEKNEVKETKRNLYGINQDGITFFSQRGDCLT